MNCHSLMFFCGLIVLFGLLVPAVSATEPLWTSAASTNGELSGVVISADGSTIVAGGDQLIAFSRDGNKRWTGWSGSRLVISSDGNYLLTARDQTFRLFDGSGTMLWDESLGVPVNDIDMTPNASLILAGGGSRVKLMDRSGSGVRYNTSIYVSHLRLYSGGNRIVFTSKNGVQTSNLTLLTEWEDTNMTQDLVEVPADGSSFVTVTNNRVRLYDEYGEMAWEQKLPGGNALAFALSRDGSTIVIGRDDKTLTALDFKGTVLWTKEGTGWITSVAVSDDGNTIVSGSIDRTITVYDREGTELGSFTAREPIMARSVAVSGDGTVIAAADASMVYGFSRDQFTRPATPAPSPMVVSERTTLPPTPAATTAAPQPPLPATTATPKAALPLPVTLLVPGILLFLRPRDS
jgi:WD40 repeat protein